MNEPRLDYDAKAVVAFSKQMLERLDANAHKGRGGWRSLLLPRLVVMLGEEFTELLGALWLHDRKQIKLEAVDLANVCMMVADVLGGSEVD